MKALLPLDGSDTARSVLPTARRLLQLVPGAQFHLFTVLDPRSVQGSISHVAEEFPPITPGGAGPAVASPLPRVIESHGEAMDRVATETREGLEATAKSELAGAPVTLDVEWSRHAAEAIVAKAEAIGADVVVMATHGRSGLSHVVTGSVTEEVIRTSGRPVLVIHSRRPEAAG